MTIVICEDSCGCGHSRGRHRHRVMRLGSSCKDCRCDEFHVEQRPLPPISPPISPPIMLSFSEPLTECEWQRVVRAWPQQMHIGDPEP